MVHPQASPRSATGIRKIASPSPAGKVARSPRPKPTVPMDEVMIPLGIFKLYKEFQDAGRENALRFFVHNPEYEEWGAWIMINYTKARDQYEAILKMQSLVELAREFPKDKEEFDDCKKRGGFGQPSLFVCDHDLMQLLGALGPLATEEIAQLVALMWNRDPKDAKVRMLRQYENGNYPSIAVEDGVWSAPC